MEEARRIGGGAMGGWVFGWAGGGRRREGGVCERASSSTSDLLPSVVTHPGSHTHAASGARLPRTAAEIPSAAADGGAVAGVRLTPSCPTIAVPSPQLLVNGSGVNLTERRIPVTRSTTALGTRVKVKPRQTLAGHSTRTPSDRTEGG